LVPEQQAARGFREIFGREASCIVRSPGRVNLIGDHTDYNEGFVLPIAIDRAFYVAAAATGSRLVRVYSNDLKETAQLPVAGGTDQEIAPWARYAWGVLALLGRQGVEPPGADVWIGGDLPLSAGLSSSAALEVGVALAVLHLAGVDMPRPELAQLCRHAENEFAGSPCGIMDQLCVCCAEAGHALLIDCRSLGFEPVPLNMGETQVLVIDTGVRHSVAGAEYGARRRQCAEALERIRHLRPACGSLRDVQEKDLPELTDALGPFLAGRVRHVVTENARVVAAAEALRCGDLTAMGRLMFASHRSLRDDFQVSCKQLDEVVAIAENVDGVWGARMTGGGFGGCAIVLADERAVALLKDSLLAAGGLLDLASGFIFPVCARRAAEVLEACTPED
jgi:galactokinase